LVISTPATIVSGLAAAARHGILIKGGAFLEKGRSLRCLALDKTGTITSGKPCLTDIISAGTPLSQDMHLLAASLAARSDHPLSAAIVKGLARPSNTLKQVQNFSALPGKGIDGNIDGEYWYMGSLNLAREKQHTSPSLELQAAALEQQGKTVVLMGNSTAVHTVFAVADTIKESSRHAIEQLHALGVQTVMLTGDNTHTANIIAQQTGIDSVKSQLLPQDKLQEIEHLRTQGTVGMVGDGINDAPALAKADLGFAMAQNGTDTAIETADIALMDDNLCKIPQFVRLARSTYAILIQNMILALGLKALFFGLALSGHATMWMAVFADVGATLLVVANGLRARYL
jgi:Cd2+/Zn2+-exporting ATPase